MGAGRVLDVRRRLAATDRVDQRHPLAAARRFCKGLQPAAARPLRARGLREAMGRLAAELQMRVARRLAARPLLAVGCRDFMGRRVPKRVGWRGCRQKDGLRMPMGGWRISTEPRLSQGRPLHVGIAAHWRPGLSTQCSPGAVCREDNVMSSASVRSRGRRAVSKVLASRPLRYVPDSTLRPMNGLFYSSARSCGDFLALLRGWGGSRAGRVHRDKASQGGLRSDPRRAKRALISLPPRRTLAVVEGRWGIDVPAL